MIFDSFSEPSYVDPSSELLKRAHASFASSRPFLYTWPLYNFLQEEQANN